MSLRFNSVNTRYLLHVSGVFANVRRTLSSTSEDVIGKRWYATDGKRFARESARAARAACCTRSTESRRIISCSSGVGSGFEHETITIEQAIAASTCEDGCRPNGRDVIREGENTSRFVLASRQIAMKHYITLIILCAILFSCDSSRETPRSDTSETVEQTPTEESIRTYSFRIVAKIPHDTAAFTQGLEVYNGEFLESTGLNGKSTIRRVNIRTGAVIKREPLEATYFGEGITVLRDTAYMLTWLNQRGLVYDPVSLRRIREFRYAGEGWGITDDGTHLILSNGSNILTVINPATSSIVRSIPVTMQGSLVGQLNELEWVNGEIWANVWQTMKILRINPTTGSVVGIIDCTGIIAESELSSSMDVFNGIGYDSVTKAIYVTGKNWPKVYQIELQ